jgi:hypothetical protein
VAPSGPVRPVIDGEVTSYFEWIGAGIYRVDERSGSMHGKTFLVKEVHFGSDGANFYLRVDFHSGCERDLARMEARLTAQTLDGAQGSSVEMGFANGAARATGMKLAVSETDQPVECAFARVLEVRLSLKSMGVERGGGLRFQFSLWQAGLPLDAVPQRGWLEMRTTDPLEMAG